MVHSTREGEGKRKKKNTPVALAGGGKERAFRHLCPVVPSNGRAPKAGTTRIRAIESVFDLLKKGLTSTRRWDGESIAWLLEFPIDYNTVSYL